MNWLDISTYITLYGHGLFAGTCISVMTGGFAMGISWDVMDNPTWKRVAPVVLVAFLFPIVLGAFSLVPSHGKILKVKIEKIKNEAVTEENLREGIDVIERIGKKLECKYLGCEE